MSHEAALEPTARRELWDRETVRRWSFRLAAGAIVILGLATALGWFDGVATSLNVADEMWVATRQIVAGIIVIVALGWVLTIWHGEAYLAAFWFTAPRLPGLIAAGWLLAYLAPPLRDAPLPPAAPLAIGLWTTVIVWLLLLVPFRRIAEIPTAEPETYRELLTRFYQIQPRIEALRKSASADAAGALGEAEEQLEVVRKLLDLPKDGPPRAKPKDDVVGGIEWATSTGYISAWEALNRADEALIDASSIDAAISEGLHDMLRLAGSSITNADRLQDALRAAVRQHDPELDLLYFFPQRRRMGDPIPSPPKVERDAAASSGHDETVKGVIREVRHAVNTYRIGHASALVRARNRLLKSILVTGIAADILLALAILMQVPKSAVAAAAVFFLIGGVVGLFNRLRLEGEGGPAMASDYGLFEARLLGTLLISGLAGIGGVILVSAAPLANAINGGSASAALPLTSVFSLELNRAGPVVAALFGLTPELIVGQLRKQTDTIKRELSSTEAAVTGAVGSESPAH